MSNILLFKQFEIFYQLENNHRIGQLTQFMFVLKPEQPTKTRKSTIFGVRVIWPVRNEHESHRFTSILYTWIHR
jgi:hypothetical protein